MFWNSISMQLYSRARCTCAENTNAPWTQIYSTLIYIWSKQSSMCSLFSFVLFRSRGTGLIHVVLFSVLVDSRPAPRFSCMSSCPDWVCTLQQNTTSDPHHHFHATASDFYHLIDPTRYRRYGKVIGYFSWRYIQICMRFHFSCPMTFSYRLYLP